MAYVGAPYNFVSLPEKPISYKEKIPSVSEINGEHYSGTISYTITARTPLFVGGSDGKQFYKNNNGEYAIKGSTMRGLIRNNAQILSLGSLKDDVDGNFKMMFRKVGSPSSDPDKKNLKNYYDNALKVGIYRIPRQDGGGTVSIRENVKAGILVKEKNENEKPQYFIIPSMQGPFDLQHRGQQNYYLLRENTIIGALIRQKEKSGSYQGSGYEYLIQPSMNVLMYDHKGRYPFYGKGDVSKGAFNPHFRPSVKEISFHLGMNQLIDHIEAPGILRGNNCYEGYFVSSGYMNKKKTHYVIVKENHNAKKIPVPEDSVRAYQADYEARKNLFGTTQSFRGISPEEKGSIKEANRKYYALPEEGEKKPVFYVDKIQDHLYFGFTPNLRLYFNHTINDAVPESQTLKTDYARALFGYTAKNVTDKKSTSKIESRKGRVSFNDASIILQKGEHPEGKFQKPILGGPKPTSFYDYLTQPDPNHAMTYNDDGIEIRGYKQYWLHQREVDCSAMDSGRDNEKVASSFTPLVTGTKFHGEIHFNNLTEEELGLLLWAVRLEEGCEQNIGKAKSYGFGRIAIQIDDLKLLDFNKMYRLDSLDFAPYKKTSQTADKEADKLITAFKDSASAVLGYNIMENPSVEQFFIMKNTRKMPSEDDIHYMNLARNRRNRRPDHRHTPGVRYFPDTVQYIYEGIRSLAAEQRFLFHPLLG